MGYIVITSVDRDDMEDGGADHYARTVKETKRLRSSQAPTPAQLAVAQTQHHDANNGSESSLPSLPPERPDVPWQPPCGP